MSCNCRKADLFCYCRLNVFTRWVVGMMLAGSGAAPGHAEDCLCNRQDCDAEENACECKGCRCH